MNSGFLAQSLPLWGGVLLTLAGLALGALYGRRTGATRDRLREVEGEIEVLRQQGERTFAEKEAAQGELGEVKASLETSQRDLEVTKGFLQEAQDQVEVYRKKVVDHFYGTSEQLQKLTLQYREVYDHLAQGARDLCPEEFIELQGGLAGALEAGERNEAEDVSDEDDATSDAGSDLASEDEDRPALD